MTDKNIKIIAKNKRASFDYFLTERFEAGLILQGTEVKTLRLGKVNLTESFVEIDRNLEAWLVNMSIPHYDFGNINNHQEMRKRKLLLSRREINEIYHKIKTQAVTLIPTIIYFKDSRIKIEIALAKGKKMHDKRDTEKKRDIEKNLRQGKYD